VARDRAWPADRQRLPGINLLPREIHERRLLRRQRAGLGAALLVLLALLGAWYTLETRQLDAARRDADREQAVGNDLRVRKEALQPYSDLQRQVDTARAFRAKVYAREIRVSQVMQDIAAIVPANVWLTQMSVDLKGASGGSGASAGTTTAPAASTAASGSNGSGTSSIPGGPGAGSPVAGITFSGSGLGFVDVGQFVRALAAGPTKDGQRIYTNPYFTSSQKSDGAATVTFSATVDVSSAAYSGRFQRAG
jgi:Fimbrial assembly protein (PilN)